MSDIIIEGKNLNEIDQSNFQSVGPYVENGSIAVYEPWQGREIDFQGNVTELTYDDDGVLLTKLKKSAAMDSQAGPLFSLKTQYILNAFGQNETIIDPLGISTEQHFCRRGLLKMSIRDPQNKKFCKAYEYNGQGKRINLIQGDEKAPNQYALSFEQDKFNRTVAKTIDPAELFPSLSESKETMEETHENLLSSFEDHPKSS